MWLREVAEGEVGKVCTVRVAYLIDSRILLAILFWNGYMSARPVLAD